MCDEIDPLLFSFSDLDGQTLFVCVGEMPPILCVLIIAQLQIVRQRDQLVENAYGSIT